jgi:hypothetical protein
VETPDDALQCFLSTEMDCLVMDRFVVSAAEFASFVPVRNDLALTASAHWSPTASAYTLLSVSVERRNGHPDSSRTLPVSLEQLNLLRLIDGRRPVGAIAREVGKPVHTVVCEVLALVREGLLRWAHLEGCSRTTAAHASVNVGPMPYLEAS